MKPTSPMTDAQRRVLERMEKGTTLSACPLELAGDGRCHFNSGGRFPETVYKTTAAALIKRGFIERGKPGVDWWVISYEGRKALNERPGA